METLDQEQHKELKKFLVLDCQPGILAACQLRVRSSPQKLGWRSPPSGRLTMGRFDHALRIAFGLLRNRSEHKATAEAEPEPKAEAAKALAETGRQIAALCGRRRALGSKL